MTAYSDCLMIESKLRDGMYPGNRHNCRRDVGRIAGGCLASGRITHDEASRLRELAISLSSDGAALGAKEWDEGVAFGSMQPLAAMPIPVSTGHAVDWDEIVNPENYHIVDHNWLETEAVVAPDDWNPCRQLSEYLSLVFEPEEKVVFCTHPFSLPDGGYAPTRGDCKTVEELQKSLSKGTKDGFEEAVGTIDDHFGAMIRINPFDGSRDADHKLCVKDVNVTAFRHALIECDTIPVDEQVAIYRKLELPCSCIVHSGGKSAHAIVRIDADDVLEYRKRVDFLFKICERNGLEFDRSNRNPSRYSRMPGVMRNGNKQFLISGRCGRASWDDWRAWLDEQNDNLPDFETLTADEISNPPPAPAELIEGVLSVGSKMIVAGPSKAGKSFLLIELAISIAEGLKWVGHKCSQGRVLYVNLELHKDSCTRRFAAVYKNLGIKSDHCSFIDRWNLRGCAEPMDSLAPKLIRRAKNRGYALVIIDPIYKVLTGDENSAADMAEFSRYFDRIAYECGCAVAFCHHHSKGDQMGKSTADRASGSGVFVRDTDALIDMMPLEATAARQQLQNRYECDAMIEAARCESYDGRWEEEVAEDDKIVANRLVSALPQVGFDEDQMTAVRAARAAAIKRCESVTAWRLEYTLRDFATPKPLGLWFMYPGHFADEEDLLTDCKFVNDGGKQKSRKEGAAKQDRRMAFVNLVKFKPGETWTLAKVAEQMGVSEKTISRYCAALGYAVDRGVIKVKQEEEC